MHQAAVLCVVDKDEPRLDIGTVHASQSREDCTYPTVAGESNNVLQTTGAHAIDLHNQHQRIQQQSAHILPKHTKPESLHDLPHSRQALALAQSAHRNIDLIYCLSIFDIHCTALHQSSLCQIHLASNMHNRVGPNFLVLHAMRCCEDVSVVNLDTSTTMPLVEASQACHHGELVTRQWHPGLL